MKQQYSHSTVVASGDDYASASKTCEEPTTRENIVLEMAGKLVHKRRPSFSTLMSAHQDTEDQDTENQSFVVKTPIIDLPEFHTLVPRTRSFVPLQEWEGHVIEIGADHFTARLTDVTVDASQADEEADFPLDELADEDRKILKVGAVFRWNIGYERSGAGSKRRVSQIVLRRLPQWTQRDLKKADDRARRILDTLQWE